MILLRGGTALADMVVVAMSGGVDSSVAAALLVQQGYDAVGVTLNLWPRASLIDAATRHSVCCSLEAVEDARRVCDTLGIPHYTLNFREVFEREVVRDFLLEYKRGRTPNPCIRCNRYVKFAALLDKAKSLGARYLATGHYARVERSLSGRYLLKKSLHPAKDQSYALYSLTQEQLAHTLFPLGELEKTETRRLASQLGLVTASKVESQEVCFVPDGDRRAFVSERLPEAARTGPIVNASGEVLGTHPGVAFFTVGQRKGLGLAAGKPLYVIDILAEEHTVVVGEEHELYCSGLVAEDVNWVSVEQPPAPIRVSAKIRYRSNEILATAAARPDGRLEVRFDAPQRAVSPGQAVVLYDGDSVVGGGTIIAPLGAGAGREQPGNRELAGTWMN